MFHIVDDNSFIREFLGELLKDLGFETMDFECPQKYINFVNSDDYKRPTAIFTDVTMPIMNGYEMINIVAELIAGIKFVVMTGEPHIRSEYIAKSCMYIGKPFAPQIITGVVAKLVDCHHSGPSCQSWCNKMDDHKLFPLHECTCPHAGKDVSS